MKEYYKEEVKNIMSKLKQFQNCFSFAVVADTHLDNSIGDTVENIKAVREKHNFSCLLHLGDFLNGSFPRTLTMEILKGQMDLFRKAAGNSPFYPVQGNHDGFADLLCGMPNIALNEDWYEATDFTENYKNVVRDKNKPYFYVDYPEKKIRLVILCTFFYKYGENGVYEKVYGTDTEQINWAEKKAFNVQSDWTVMIFSHDAPFEFFDERACSDNPRINGNMLMDAVKRARSEHKFTLAAWFVGHFHGDYVGAVNGINFILTASETAYVPTLWDMPHGGYYPPRELGTSSEDLWDICVFDRENRAVKMLRFGAGSDRELKF